MKKKLPEQQLRMRKGFCVLTRAILINVRGLRVLVFSDKQVAAMKQKKNILINLGQVSLSVKTQAELFKFLSFYYTEGQNIYGLLLKYQQLVDKKTRRILKHLLSEIRKGVGFSEAVMTSGLFEPDIRPLLMVSKVQGLSSTVLSEIEKMLSRKQQERKEYVKKAIYPGMLIVMSLLMVVFVSYSVVPNFLVFFQDSDMDVPLLLRILSKEHLWKIGVVLVVSSAGIIFMIRKMKNSVKLAIPIFNEQLKVRFQESFWRVCLVSIDTGVAVEELLEDYINEEGKSYISYYYSTILARLRRGLPIEQATDVPVVDKKQRILLGIGAEQYRKRQLYLSFIEELKERKIFNQSIVSNGLSGVALLFIASLVLLLGYVMLTPLRQITDFI